MKQRLIASIHLLLCLLTNVVAFTQIANYELGGMRLKFVGKSKDLMMKAALGSVLFHANVGGVSFEQIATPDNTINGRKITLNYISNNADSSRLEIGVGDSKDSIYKYTPVIPDWQLLPIAFYANDTNNAIFTLGRNYVDTSFSPIEYHFAFKNQLLGLRMFQADLLFSNCGANVTGLPTDSLGRSLIADSERKFKLNNNKDSYYNLIDKLKEVCNGYSSYVLTDWGKEVTFGVSGSAFRITGEPYYLFTTKETEYTPELAKLDSTLRDFKKGLLILSDPSYKNLSTLLQKEKLSENDITAVTRNLKDLVNKSSEPFRYYFESPYDLFSNPVDTTYPGNDITYLKDCLVKINHYKQLVKDPDFIELCKVASGDVYSWTKAEVNDIIDNLNEKYDYVFSSLIQSDDSYPQPYKMDLLLCESRSMERANNEIYNFNQPVFHSCITTMRYAAFFRYVKQQYPQEWQRFMDQISRFKGKYILPTKAFPLNQGILTPNQIEFKYGW